MANSAVDIASQALAQLRANTIGSLSDDSNEARIAALYYPDFVSDIFSRVPWSFATKKKQLLRDVNNPLNEYQYAYVIPAEVIRILKVFRDGEVRALPIRNYDIQAPTTGRRIMTDEEKCFIEYTYYPDESQWPGYFVSYAVAAFAALIAIPLTDDAGLAQQMQQLAYGTPGAGENGGRFAVAYSIDGQQKPYEPVIDYPIINARFS